MIAVTTVNDQAERVTFMIPKLAQGSQTAVYLLVDINNRLGDERFLSIASKLDKNYITGTLLLRMFYEKCGQDNATFEAMLNNDAEVKAFLIEQMAKELKVANKKPKEILALIEQIAANNINLVFLIKEFMVNTGNNVLTFDIIKELVELEVTDYETALAIIKKNTQKSDDYVYYLKFSE